MTGRRAPWARALPPAILAAIVSLTDPASAHAGGAGISTGAFQLPAWVIWALGGGVVAISFAMVGAWLSHEGRGGQRSTKPVTPGDVRALPQRWVGLARLLSLALLFLLLAPVLQRGSTSEMPVAMVWVATWGLLPVASYLVGNLWLVVSPFRALAGLADKLRRGKPPARYPKRLGAWPSVILLLSLIGLEVTTGAAQDPSGLARIVLGYTLFTFLGMAFFGAKAWLGHVEVLDRVFAWWSAFAPAGLGPDGVAWRRPGGVLPALEARGWADVCFAVALLYGVNFDAFLATRAAGALRAGLESLGPTGSFVAVLALGYAIFLVAFLACVVAIGSVASTLQPSSSLARRFAVSLLPIAIGYHLAHNLPYLLAEAPGLIRALSDPLGLGWDPLGLAGVSWLAGPSWLWATLQMGLIIAGHVLAVVAAHGVAFNTFPSRVQAVKSELPLTLVMVFYTVIGLWIASQGHGVALA